MDTAHLITIEEFIGRAKRSGYRFGKGNPKNRLRYLTKVGVLPHAVRFQSKETDAHTSGFYPESAVQLLLSAQKLKRQEKLSAEKIAEKYWTEGIRGEGEEGREGQEGERQYRRQYTAVERARSPIPLSPPEKGSASAPPPKGRDLGSLGDLGEENLGFWGI